MYIVVSNYKNLLDGHHLTKKTCKMGPKSKEMCVCTPPCVLFFFQHAKNEYVLIREFVRWAPSYIKNMLDGAQDTKKYVRWAPNNNSITYIIKYIYINIYTKSTLNGTQLIPILHKKLVRWCLTDTHLTFF